MTALPRPDAPPEEAGSLSAYTDVEYRGRGWYAATAVVDLGMHGGMRQSMLVGARWRPTQVSCCHPWVAVLGLPESFPDSVIKATPFMAPTGIGAWHRWHARCEPASYECSACGTVTAMRQAFIDEKVSVGVPFYDRDAPEWVGPPTGTAWDDERSAS